MSPRRSRSRAQPVSERLQDEGLTRTFHINTGESFRFDLSRPLIRPAWSNEAACFVHAAGGCHLPRRDRRSHPLLDTICSLRRSNLSSNALTPASRHTELQTKEPCLTKQSDQPFGPNKL